MKPASRKAGVVVPHTLNWSKRLIALLIYLLIRSVACTLRLRLEIPPQVLASNRPMIYATWHNRLPLCLLMYTACVRALGRPFNLAAIVSASKDGAVVARILEHFGVRPVRGSTSRRGPQALLEATRYAKQGCDLALTPDGPRGPRYEVQAGVIALGQLTGMPLVPASNHIAWKIRLKSWDGFQIPLPLSRAIYRYGEPLVVPREATEQEREELRLEFERRMRALSTD